MAMSLVPVRLSEVTRETEGIIIYPDGKTVRSVKWNNTFGIPANDYVQVDWTGLYCSCIADVQMTARHTPDLRRYIPKDAKWGNPVDKRTSRIVNGKKGGTLYKVGACTVIVPDEWATHPVKVRAKRPANTSKTEQ